MENLEKITWESGLFVPRRTEDYPCIVCQNHIAVYSASFSSGDDTIRHTMSHVKFCQVCMDKGEPFIRGRLFKRR